MALTYNVKFLKGTAANYASIGIKDANTFYYVTDKNKLYLGEIELTTTDAVASAVALVSDSTKGNEAIYSKLSTLVGDGDGSISKMIESAITTAKSEVVNTIEAADKSVTVGGTTTAATVKTNISAEANNNLQLKDDGLYVNVPAGTDYTVTVKESTSEGYAKAYTIAQAATGLSATINIPKDMVVSSGTVETNPSGQDAGTYLVLTLANADNSKVYINVSDLIEYVTAGDDTATIHVEVSADHKVTAKVIDGSIGTTQLATSVVTSLNKADSALQSSDVTTGTTNGTIKVKDSEVSVAGLGTAAYAATGDFDASGAASAVKTALEGTSNDTASSATITGAKKYADSLANNYDAKGAASSALSDAKSYTDTAISDLDAEVSTGTDSKVQVTITEADGKLTAVTASIADGTYDTSGAASTALTNAKAYTDDTVNEALTWGTF